MKNNRGEDVPYSSRIELPQNVQHVSPLAAQTIYLEAFNYALVEYSDSSKRYKNEGLEQTAAPVAWAAVKRKYKKSRRGIWELQ